MLNVGNGIFVVTLSTLTLFAPASAHAAPGSFDLSSPANGAWCTATCTFTWQAASTATSYQLYVDAVLKKDAIAPTSPPAYTLAAGEALAEGWHTWYVVAKDSGGTTTQSTSTWSVHVDATPPSVPSLLTPAASDWTSATAPTFTWTASTDTGSGLAGYELWINGALVQSGIVPAATAVTQELPLMRLLNAFGTNCAGWTYSGRGWDCPTPGLGFDEGSICIYDNGYDSGTATLAAVLDFSNAGHTEMAYNYKVQQWMASDGYTTLETRVSDDGGTTWNMLHRQPPITATRTSTDTLSLDDFTGTNTAKIQFYGYNTACSYWLIYWVTIDAIMGGTYNWQIVAIDVAGNRTLSESRPLRYDLPPVPFNLSAPADGTWTANTKPTLSWNATTDVGSGLAKYQLWLDAALATDSISAAATETTPGNALADGTHAWQIYAIDGSGAVRKSRQTWNIGIDTTPPQAFSLLSPADQSATGIPTPTLCWNAATDSGSGVDHYQLLVDGTMVRDNITSTCSTPTSTLAEGTHTWSVKAIDKMSNSRDSTQTWTIYADFGPPAGFSLLAPANGSTVDTLTPTFTWGAASDAGGLSHYELHIDSTCVACSIAATSTTFTLTTPLTAASHSWSVTAVDHAANSTVATGAPWTFTAGECAPDSAVACAGNSTGACNPGTHTCSASGTWGTCTGVVTPVAENCGNGIDDDCDGLVDCADPDCAAACGIVSEPGPEAGAEPRPELGPEPTTEPPRDAGVDVASDSAQDSPATTATATNTATTTPTGTSTATTTVTGSNTGTATVTGIATSTGPTGTGSATVTVTATGMTATGTSISTGSGFDAAPPVGIADAFNADVAILPVPDAAALRDGAVADATGGLADAATAITPTSDAGLGMFDGGSVLADTGAGGKADALSTRQEGGQTATVDGARAGDAASAKTGASGGCGCALGGARTDRNTVWSLVGIALLVLWRRRSRPR